MGAPRLDPAVTAKSRLSQRDWTDAALAAMASQGTAGVNVEQLARDLGTTKGSFYHHFDNRDTLLRATLDRFLAIIQADLNEASTIADPRERLIQASLAGLDSSIDGFVDLALAASATDPVVAAALQRITEVRLDYLVAALNDLGLKPAEARRRAEGGLATYLGIFHLQRVQGRRFDTKQQQAHLVRAIDVMCSFE